MGRSTTSAIVNLQLLDAIEKIRKLKNDGYYKFQETDSLYMISPALISNELKFLKTMDFKTQSYGRKDLEDSNFVEQNPEAQLAIQKFGTDSQIGTAAISLDTLNTPQWQEKRKNVISILTKKGITLDMSDKYI